MSIRNIPFISVEVDSDDIIDMFIIGVNSSADE